MSVVSMHLFQFLKENIQLNDWSIECWEQGNCVVIENKSADIVFDIWNIDKSKWKIQLFKRHGDTMASFTHKIDDKWLFNGERYDFSEDLKNHIDILGILRKYINTLS